MQLDSFSHLNISPTPWAVLSKEASAETKITFFRVFLICFIVILELFYRSIFVNTLRDLKKKKNTKISLPRTNRLLNLISAEKLQKHVPYIKVKGAVPRTNVAKNV